MRSSSGRSFPETTGRNNIKRKLGIRRGNKKGEDLKEFGEVREWMGRGVVVVVEI